MASSSSASSIPALTKPASSNGFHLPSPVQDAAVVQGISDRMHGLFQVASILPFFLTSWVVSGMIVKDVFLFTAIFGALVLGSMAQSVELHRDTIPFPDQFQTCLAAALGLCLIATYHSTENIELTAVVAAAGALRFLGFRLQVANLRALFLVIAALVLSSSMSAPLGAFLETQQLYPPYAIFGLVPGLILSASLVVKYSPLLEGRGWERSREHIGKDGKKSLRPGNFTRLYALLIVSGPLIPVGLVLLHFLPDIFVLPIFSLVRLPNLADGILKRTLPEARVFIETVLIAFLAEALLLIAAFL